MFGFLKFLVLCALAIAAGVAAVSVPVAGKTVAAHVESWFGEEAGEQAPGRKAVAKPALRAPPRVAGKATPTAPAVPAAKRRVDEADPTPAERAALENLIGAKTARSPGQGR